MNVSLTACVLARLDALLSPSPISFRQASQSPQHDFRRSTQSRSPQFTVHSLLSFRCNSDRARPLHQRHATMAMPLPAPQPLASSPPAMHWCSGCAAMKETRTLACAKCKAAWFCSKDCQTTAWKAGHKKACKSTLLYNPKAYPPELLRKAPLDVIDKWVTHLAFPFLFYKPHRCLASTSSVADAVGMPCYPPSRRARPLGTVARLRAYFAGGEEAERG